MANRSYSLTLAGIVSDVGYQRCLTCLKSIQERYPGIISSSVLQFFPSQWEQYLQTVQNDLKGHFYQHKGSPLVILNGQTYIGGEKDFIMWAQMEFRYVDKIST